MATLHVRSFPDLLYEQLQELASSRSQSISAAVVELLTCAVEDEQHRKGQQGVLSRLRRRRFERGGKTPTSLALLREDRKR